MVRFGGICPLLHFWRQKIDFHFYLLREVLLSAACFQQTCLSSLQADTQVKLIKVESTSIGDVTGWRRRKNDF